MRNSALVIVLLAGFVTTAPSPLRSDVEFLLAEMRTAYARIHMARISFADERPGAPRAALFGVVEWAGHGRLSAKFVTRGSAITIVRTNGSKIVIDRSRQRDVKPFHHSTLRESLPGDLVVAALFDWRRALSTGPGGDLRGATLTVHRDVEWGGRRWTVLKVIRSNEIVRVLVDPTSHLIWRTERIDRRTGTLIAASTVERLDVRE